MSAITAPTNRIASYRNWVMNQSWVGYAGAFVMGFVLLMIAGATNLLLNLDGISAMAVSWSAVLIVLYTWYAVARGVVSSVRG